MLLKATVLAATFLLLVNVLHIPWWLVPGYLLALGLLTLFAWVHVDDSAREPS